MREHNERAWLAWHIAALQRSKKLPKLKTLFSKATSRTRRMTWQQQMAVMDQWVAHTQRAARKPVAQKKK